MFKILLIFFFLIFNINKVSAIDQINGFKVKNLFSSKLFLIDTAKAPTIILSHGSGGIWKHIYMWKDRLNKNGFNVVIVDHHTEKKIKPHVGMRNYKDFPEERIKDLLKLSRRIKKQKWNKNKI